MEAFRGTSMGMDFPDRYHQNKAAYNTFMGPKKALVLAISGDQIVHLLWRLQNGEGPKGLDPQVVTVMIGTNDLAHLTSLLQARVPRDDDERIAATISRGVQQSVREVQQQAPQATVIVFGLLPLQPMMLHAPQRLFDSKVEAANRAIAAFAAGEASAKLKFKDCGGDFVDKSGAIKQELMPDGVHPAGGGADVLLKCMLEAIGK
ncbi:hypothetical protein CHLNCDRAFT_141743 [Chlorella variabilis]|uniref:SGNH hydrolase-type esterase domain-containing protein n=1 Tax=Chlorella variabilis TaxID=554065 RepID=E1ZTI0_CHLVA|nr:hypothetical protein CHLNCDRAFT_141743 [Chlorella variabilis]EFN50812.1 hypothetical protein CHLNCDRAFT_141743 [Chlorella variabilis]|eukprot:XP_005842914.1 hypothetical protein CHLNCDRAFT_141743 [Chlorella variabilis]